jgi:hypothetical protein
MLAKANPFNWRKIDSNYHICNANTTDYRYQISPFLLGCSLKIKPWLYLTSYAATKES